MVRDVSRLDPGPQWALRGEEGGLGPAHPTLVLCAGLGGLGPRRLDGHPRPNTDTGILRPCLSFTLGEKYPNPSSGSGGRASWSTGLRWGEGGQVQGGGTLIHLKNSLGTVLKQIQVGVQVPDSPLGPHHPHRCWRQRALWGQSREAAWE